MKVIDYNDNFEDITQEELIYDIKTLQNWVNKIIDRLNGDSDE